MSHFYQNILERARILSHEAHDSIGQVRKYTGEPYWVHTDEVAEIVKSVGGTDDMIAAAYLHDVLEDVFPKNPKYGPNWIEVNFSKAVLDLVYELTDEFISEKYPDWNRAKRKLAERERVGKASLAAKTIKLADLISNTKSIVEHDKDFARVYLQEKLDALPYLADGNSELLNRASVQAVTSLQSLGLTPMTICSK